MPKKTKNIIIFTGIAIIILLAAFGFWYFKTADTGQDFVDTFFNFDFPEFEDLPFGQNGNSGNTGDILSDINKNLPLFSQISNTKTAGFVFFNKKVGEGDKATTTPFLRFIERSTGYVYEVNISIMEKTRITNTTIPRIYEALFGADGKNVILRYLDDDNVSIQSFVGEIIEKDDNTERIIDGEFIAVNIKDMILSPDKNDVFYFSISNDGVTGIISDIAGKDNKVVFEFPFSEWIPQWVESGIYLSTKPSYNTEGYLYKLNTRNGGLQKILGGIEGLTTLASNSGNKILYSESDSSGVFSYIYDTVDQKSNATPFDTLPEKCVWDEGDIKIYCAAPVYFKNENYPDSWYQGKISFDDLLWVLYTDSNVIDIIGDPFKETGNNMDIINPVLSENEDYLFFINKKDMTLWMVNLQQTMKDNE